MHLPIPLILSAIFCAAFLKGLTGMGFSTICLGILASFIDIKVAILMVLLPSMLSNAMVIADSGRFRDAITKYWHLYACTLPGMAFGLWTLGSVDSVWARTVLGVVVGLYGVWALWSGPLLLPERLRRPLAVPVGLVTGFVNGLTGSQIMPILPYLLALPISKELLIAIINTSFTLSSVLMFFGLGKLGLLTLHGVLVSALGVPLVFLGIRFGGALRSRASEELFRKMVLFLLIGIGLNLVFNH